MKENLFGIGFVVVLVLLCVMSCYFIYDTYVFTTNVASSRRTEVNSNIGAKVILNKDTLVVVDHSYLGSTYTLSNNVKIESSLIDSIKINKK